MRRLCVTEPYGQEKNLKCPSNVFLTHVQLTYNVYMGRGECFLTYSCLEMAMRGVFVNADLYADLYT